MTYYSKVISATNSGLANNIREFNGTFRSLMYNQQDYSATCVDTMKNTREVLETTVPPFYWNIREKLSMDLV